MSAMEGLDQDPMCTLSHEPAFRWDALGNPGLFFDQSTSPMSDNVAWKGCELTFQQMSPSLPDQMAAVFAPSQQQARMPTAQLRHGDDLWQPDLSPIQATTGSSNYAPDGTWTHSGQDNCTGAMLSPVTDTSSGMTAARSPDRPTPKRKYTESLESLGSLGLSADDVSAEENMQNQGLKEDPEMEEMAESEDRSPRPRKRRERERNRVAAAKCRQKAKVGVQDLQERERALFLENRSLATNVDALRNEVIALKVEILRHSDCGSDFIQQYINKSAMAVAQKPAAD
ncbi:hypothetical protein F4780DRAFT_704551 [Xylariomycetidae sp. FL0641]|nr:hypothetical protein F4780DRAFT_704551 [Xylariomycetidae sp. FL0641]